MTDFKRNKWLITEAELKIDPRLDVCTRIMEINQIMKVLLLVRGEVNGYIIVKRYFMFLKTFAAILSYQLSSRDNRELNWMITDLKIRLIKQRIPELIIKADDNEIAYLRKQNFYKVNDKEKERIIRDDPDHMRDGCTLSIILEYYFKNRVPILDMPVSYQSFKQADQVESVLKRWRDTDILKTLQSKLVVQMTNYIVIDDDQNKQKDSEETPPFVLNWITEKLLIY